MSAVAAGIVAGGAVIGSVIQAGAAGHAADLQAQSAQNAQNIQQGMFNTQQSNLQPFRQAGADATSQLSYLLGTGGTPGSAPNGNTTAGGFGSLNAPFTADMFHQYSPAYQFTRQQGGQGVLNQDAGQSGALSGAALKDLTAFNSGYANNAFNNAFSQYNTQQNNTFSRLSGLANIGEAAAANSATGASSFGASIGNSAQNVGTAQAGGVVGGANAIAGGINAATPWLYAGGGGAGGGSGFTPLNAPSMGGSTSGWGSGADGIPVNW